MPDYGKSDRQTEVITIERGKRIGHEEEQSMLKMFLNGYKAAEIAKLHNRPTNTVYNRLERWRALRDHFQSVEEFRKDRSNILDAVESMSLQSLATKLDAGEGNLQQLSSVFREVFKARRLETGKSTQNIESHNFSKIALDSYKD